jgi:putative endonuclease
MLSEHRESKHPVPRGGCYVYMVECDGGSIYTGLSSNPQRRFREHQNGGSRFTSGRSALRLLCTEHHPTRSAAAHRERQLKGWTRAKKLALAHADLAALKNL